MRYSKMTPAERLAILGKPANYPLKVTFLGKGGLVGAETVDLLRENGVDFVVDEEQARRLLAGEPTTTGVGVDPAAPPVAARLGPPEPPRQVRRPRKRWLAAAGVAVAGAAAVASRLLTRR